MYEEECRESNTCGVGSGDMVKASIKQPIAQDILSFANSLADRSNMIAGELGVKLEPICSQPNPQNDDGSKDPRQYPPLFDELRKRLLSIESSLNTITDVMDRIEV